MKNKKMNKGITLVALVVTIVILIILATISINAVLGENGLIRRAEKAAEYQANAEKSESDAIDQLLHQAGVATGEIIENPYDKDGWKYAWVCTNGVWDNTKYETGADIPKGEGIVVAKLYETGNKITPPSLKHLETTYTFTEGNEYVMVIEGQGEMGPLMESNDTGDITGAYGWHTETVMVMMNPTGATCTIPYVSQVRICDGVTNIGEAAFLADTSLTKTVISKDVTTIGDYAFQYCGSLTNITIPDSVTSIESAAFIYCSSLTTVTIDSEQIASEITFASSQGELIYNATTIYINEEIEETSIGSYITTNYDKQATSDKEGYVKYTKKVS